MSDPKTDQARLPITPVTWCKRLRAIWEIHSDPAQTWKRTFFEYVLSIIPMFLRPSEFPNEVRRIFVLRSNDLGDLLAITPLFQALKQVFPKAEIIAGVGSWSVSLLQDNPYVDKVIALDVPWCNKFVPSQSLFSALWYAFTSRDIIPVRHLRCDLAIDVYGTQIGAILLLRTGAALRLSVQRPGGGFAAATSFLRESWTEHVGRHALRFAELLGARNLPEVRPQLFLKKQEYEEGELRWLYRGERRLVRIAIFVGSGLSEKCWPIELQANFLKLLSKELDFEGTILGGASDWGAGEFIKAAVPDLQNLTGMLTLRDSAAVVASADIAVSPSSFGMHLAGAYRKPCLVALSAWPLFPSASGHHALWGYPEQKHLKVGEALESALIALGVEFLRNGGTTLHRQSVADLKALAHERLNS